MLKDIKIIDKLIDYIKLFYPRYTILNINAYKIDCFSVTIRDDVICYSENFENLYFEVQFKLINNQLLFDDVYRLE